ncbi:MAG: response regulator transcription factor [Gammaproteobacteria bacterium]|nr:response regulator transcription factor [Gammaproteobacteria bacterium]
MKILLIDDDIEICLFIEKNFVRLGHTVTAVHNGNEALHLASSETFDVMIIDWMIPCLDGVALIKILRQQDIKTPVIILSAKSQIEDKVFGLQSGCDDYLTKPFEIEELIVRVNLLYKRMTSARLFQSTTISCNELVLDKISHKVTFKKKNIELQAREYKILLFLMEHKNQIVSRSVLLEHIWDYKFDPQTNIIDVHVSRLRNKLTEIGAKDMIKTVRNCGYTIKDE